MSDELTGKRIVILGLARQGTALARFAYEIGAHVVVSDIRSESELGPALDELSDLPVEIILGQHPDSLLDGTDILALSGGVSSDLPLVREAKRRGIQLTNDSLEFMKRTPGTVIGITGSAGKTTTTALTGAMAQESGRRTWIGGNIGRPLITELYHMQSEDLVVQELSSFQLELWSQSPQVAAVLNITPNHLDRHQTMAAYSEAKSKILRYQTEKDVAVLSADDRETRALTEVVRGRLRQFSLHIEVEDGAFIRQGQIWLSDKNKAWAVCDLDVIQLRGQHNVLNVLASTVLADSVGISIEAMDRAIRNFSGIEHRLELVATIKDVEYINDSIATAPERALAALDAFSEPIILLAGGRDKEMEWNDWATQVLERVEAIVLFGELAETLEKILRSKLGSMASRIEIRRVSQLSEAVDTASRLAKAGDIVLLAPGGTSFDSFSDFAERGRAFRQLVLKMADSPKS
jgi:UDP-N-acetylmuramoylalanine--D-glutamate ligase